MRDFSMTGEVLRRERGEINAQEKSARECIDLVDGRVKLGALRQVEWFASATVSTITCARPPKAIPSDTG
jgi:hypothetical protein